MWNGTSLSYPIYIRVNFIMSCQGTWCSNATAPGTGLYQIFYF